MYSGVCEGEGGSICYREATLGGGFLALCPAPRMVSVQLYIKFP